MIWIATEVGSHPKLPLHLGNHIFEPWISTEDSPYLHRIHEQNITYRMLGIQLLQQGGVSSLRKMALFIDECQQAQFLQQQEQAEDELVHRWPQTSSAVWKTYKVLEVTVCREAQNQPYMTKSPLSQRIAILFFWQHSFWNVQHMIHWENMIYGQKKEKEATGRSNSSPDEVFRCTQWDCPRIYNPSLQDLQQDLP